jgi:hypothetical protein
MSSLTAPGARAGLAVASPETRRSTSDTRSEVLRRVSGEATARLAPCQQEWAGPSAKKNSDATPDLRLPANKGDSMILIGYTPWSRRGSRRQNAVGVGRAQPPRRRIRAYS